MKRETRDLVYDPFSFFGDEKHKAPSATHAPRGFICYNSEKPSCACVNALALVLKL